MNNELNFVLRPWKRKLSRLLEVLLRIVESFIILVFNPIGSMWELKIRIKHNYLRQWKNTLCFLIGNYKDEFDPIFDLDGLAMSRMSRRQREKYIEKITQRRHYVHQKFLRKSA